MAYQLEKHQSETRSPLVRPAKRKHGPAHWLRWLVARHATRVMLRRLLGRRPAEGAEGLPPHLLKDIGLSGDFRAERGVVHPIPPV